MTGDAVAPLIEVRGITKAFPGVVAVNDVSLDIHAGEIHAFVGENGAGKSTLGKMLSGALRPDGGEIAVDGVVRDHLAADEARRLGIVAVYQELSLVPWMTVEANVFLGRELRGRVGRLDRPAMRRRTVDLMERLGVSIDPSSRISGLSVAQRQLVEIARALCFEARLIIMDEPSAVLGGQNLRRLMDIVKGLRDEGMAVVYVSHRLAEVFELADRVTVLRDGRLIRTSAASETSPGELVRLMVGRDVPRVFRETHHRAPEPTLRIQGLTLRTGASPIDLSLHAGEVVGLAGMVGSGRTSLARAIAGDAPSSSGQVILDGRHVHIRRPSDAIALGICLVPEDRKSKGLLQLASIERNVGLPSLDVVSRWGFVSQGRERALAKRQVEELHVRPPQLTLRVETLSGGNQQKVVLGKWLARRPRVLVLDEPTRGIDVGAKAEVHGIVRRLARNGMAVLLISSELPEILAICDRILVMRDGAIVADLVNDGLDEERLLQAAVGQAMPPAASRPAGV